MTVDITAVRLTESANSSTPPKDTLVVGPGMGTGVTTLFTETAQHLSARFQVIGFDLPGHDQSPTHHDTLDISDIADAVAELVTNMRNSGSIPRSTKVYFAGLSISGQVALDLALNHADLFEGIAVMASSAKIGEESDWAERAETVRTQGTEAMVEMSAGAWTTPDYATNHPEKLETQKAVLANVDNETYAQLCEALGRFDDREKLANISLPLLTIHGDADMMCTIADGEFITGKVSSAQSHVLNHAAHLLPLEKPQELAEILLKNL